MIIWIKRPDDAPYRSPQDIRTRLDGAEVSGLDGLQVVVARNEMQEGYA